MAINQRLQVDWDGDGLYANVGSDVTTDMTSRLVCKRGREQSAQNQYLRSVAGRLSATLKNEDGKYDRLRTGLGSKAVPRRQVRFVDEEQVAETFSGVLVRAAIPVTNNSLDWDSRVSSGSGDLEIESNLTLGYIKISDNSSGTVTIDLERTSGSTGEMDAAFSTGVAQGKSLYFSYDGSWGEVPSTLFVNTGLHNIVPFLVPNTAPWATIRALLTSLARDTKYTFIIADAGGQPDMPPITTPFWTGYLDDLRQIPRRSGRDEVELTALGILSEVTQRRVSSQMYTDITTSTAVQAVVDGLGIPSGAVGTITGSTEMTRWWAGNQLGMETLRQLEETEGGILFENKAGQIQFDASDGRILGSHRTVSASFSDDNTADTLPLMVADSHDPVKDIANIVRVRIRSYSVGSEATLWTMPMAVELATGATIRFIAEYPDGVGSWVTPLVASADYEAFDNEDGTGTDHTSDITVAATERGAELVLDITNGHTGAVWLTLLGVRGLALTEGATTTVERLDQDSIDIYGERDYLSPALHLGTVNSAQSYADYILGLHASPLRRATVTWDVAENETFAKSNEVSDRVTLLLRDVQAPMFVESIEHRFDRGGLHTITTLLSPAEVHAIFIIIGVGPGLGEGLLAR